MVFIRTLAVAIAAVITVTLAAMAIFIVGVRTRHPRVLRFARVVQRDVLNPGALRDAGTAGSRWAVIRVPGRVSGTIYDTPVAVLRDGDALYISLVYGEDTQWLRNVRAAGGATVLLDGDEIEATSPELVLIEQTPMTTADRLASSVFGVTHALRLHAASSVPAAQD